jgi:large subunit ribosomal protein L10
MLKPEKVELVNQLVTQLGESQSVVFTDYKGLTVAEMTDLRSQLRNRGVRMRVIKNRLIKRALEGANCDALDELLVGNTALSFGVEDPVAPAKVLAEFAKDNEKLVLKGGLFEGKRLDIAGVVSLSKMLGRSELLSIMAGDLKQPATKMARVFQSGLAKMAYALAALASKKEQNGEAAA